MDTQGFVTVHHKKSRKKREQTRAIWTWADTDQQPTPEGWVPQADAAAWPGDPPPEPDDPPTALTSRNLEKCEPQCEFPIDRLHYWVPFWRDCVSLALDGREYPTNMEFYERLYDEVAQLGVQLNGGYGPYVETGWGHHANQWGHASDAGWKGGNGWGCGKRWVDPVTGEPWNPPKDDSWNAENVPADDGGWNAIGENGWDMSGDQGRGPAKKGRRRRPARGKRPVQGTEPTAQLELTNGQKPGQYQGFYSKPVGLKQPQKIPNVANTRRRA